MKTWELLAFGEQGLIFGFVSMIRCISDPVPKV
jgi:hypothetical protein